MLYAAHKAALDLFEKATMPSLYRKGQLLSDYLMFVLQDINVASGNRFIRLLTPLSAKGCQVSILMLENGKDIFQRISDKGVFADWREPDVIRVAPVPLYNSFEEVWQFGRLLQEALPTTIDPAKG